MLLNDSLQALQNQKEFSTLQFKQTEDSIISVAYKIPGLSKTEMKEPQNKDISFNIKIIPYSGASKSLSYKLLFESLVGDHDKIVKLLSIMEPKLEY